MNRPDASLFESSARIAQTALAALEHHKRGELAQAERMYREVLEHNPVHFNALHMLGVLLANRGQALDEALEALELLELAHSLNPQHETLRANLDAVRALAAQRAPATAAPAETTDPRARIAALMHGALAHQQAGRTEAAEQGYLAALALEPALPDALNMLAVIWSDRGEHARALDAVLRACRMTGWSAQMMNHNLDTLLKRAVMAGREALLRTQAGCRAHVAQLATKRAGVQASESVAAAQPAPRPEDLPIPETMTARAADIYRRLVAQARAATQSGAAAALTHTTVVSTDKLGIVLVVEAARMTAAQASLQALAELPPGPYAVTVIGLGLAPARLADLEDAIAQAGFPAHARPGLVALPVTTTPADLVRAALVHTQGSHFGFLFSGERARPNYVQAWQQTLADTTAGWSFARAVHLDAQGQPAAPEQHAEIRRYQAALDLMPGRPSTGFALLEPADVTAGNLYVARALLAGMADLGASFAMLRREIAWAALLESEPLPIDAATVERPASMCADAGEATAQGLARITQRLLVNQGAAPYAPKPAVWGLQAWVPATEHRFARLLPDDAWAHAVALAEQPAGKTADAAPAGEEALAPRGLNLVGPALAEFGLGENMRALVRAAKAAGLPHVVRDLEAQLNTRQGDHTLAGELAGRLAHRTTVVFMNPDSMRDHWPRECRAEGLYRIGYWYWELDRLPQAWHYAFDLVDEIWVASDFVRAAVERETGKPVIKIPPPIEPHLARAYTRSEFGLPEDKLVFLASFDFHSFIDRKNPYGAIDAFRRAFGPERDDVMLVIKSINGVRKPRLMAQLRAHAGGDPRIVLRDGFMSRADTTGLMSVADCYVSLHRGEGLGLGLAESMVLGKPVVATGYSGNLEFMTAENGCLVDHRLVDVRPGQYLYDDEHFVWADPDLAHAAELLRSLADDPARRAEIGARAARHMREHYSAAACGARLAARLEELGAH